MKKVLTVGLLIFGAQVYGEISTVMNHRLVTSSPLLYKQVDYAEKQLSFEIEPWASGMFDPEHTMENLGINGQANMILSQQGFGDINPELLLLGSSNSSRDYTSVISLKPELFMFGALLHFYKQFEFAFFDVKTALVNCKTIINIEEFGGGNGGMSQPNLDPIYNAYDAFTQSDWNYGKFGQAQSVIRLENIQLTAGVSKEMASFSSQDCKSYIAGFVLMEVPTGKGTTAEWLFEPQVGTNHCAFGFGADYMIAADNGFSLVTGGNFRHMIANWETRSFDLTENGQWSRYLAYEALSNFPTGPIVAGLQGINLFTQEALIEGRDQITLYARLQKRFQNCLFELSYNYFYAQQETIKTVKKIQPGYGIYDVFNSGGVSTASTATIAQANPIQDATPVALTTNDLNLSSGAAGLSMSNSIAARLQWEHEKGFTMGLGTSVDLAHSAQAISTWSLWANIEVLLP